MFEQTRLLSILTTPKRLTYDAMFSLTVSGSGTGLVSPVIVLGDTPEPALTAYSSVSFGSFTYTSRPGSITAQSSESDCYGCGVPITFGVPMLVELKLNVYASTGFALFPPYVSNASSYAEAFLQDLWVFDQSGHRTPGNVTFTEVVTPEPSYSAPVFVSLAFAAIWSLLGKRRSRSL